MRHRRRSMKLGRRSVHREMMLASLVCGLIERNRIKTTLTKAKMARSLAEKMVTLSRKGTLAARRLAIAKLYQKKHVAVLFDEIAPRFNGRQGGYTRIVKLGRRAADGSEMAVLEWIGAPSVPAKKKKKKADKAEAA